MLSKSLHAHEEVLAGLQVLLTVTLPSNSYGRPSGWVVFYHVSLPTFRHGAARTLPEGGASGPNHVLYLGHVKNQ